MTAVVNCPVARHRAIRSIDAATYRGRHPFGMSLLTGRVALVTGSSRGIGRATARLLAAEGARVVVHGTDRDAAQRVSSDIGETRAEAVVVDITAPEAASMLVDRALERFGRLDIVVNNAGFNWDAPLHEMTDIQFQAMLDVHLIAPFRVLRAAAPALLAPGPDRPQRKVVNVSSVAGTMGNAGQANYDAAKAGVIGLTKGLAKEWGPHGVGVNAVAPGFIATRLTAPRQAGAWIKTSHGRIELGIDEERSRAARQTTVLGRKGTPDEVASAILFLSCALSDYVQGQVLSVTGGLGQGMVS
jgi:3-oxoacyl-[acyl-carrier protein] reductase